MDLDGAVRAHVEWKIRLQLVLDGHEQGLDEAAASRADQCALGRWIQEVRPALAGVPQWEALRSSHEAFHLCAGAVIALARRGRRAEAQAMLGPRGEYTAASSAVVLAIVALQRVQRQPAAH